jgi:transposase
MITEEAFMDIMALHRQGHSIRFIAKKLGMHRNTVNKFIQGRRFPEYNRAKRGICILVPFVRIILDWLSQDDYRASWVYDRIKQIGYVGSYETVKKFIRPIKEQQARIAYARFETMPGLQAQVDWADFQIAEPNGKTSMVYLFILVLGYCRAIYAEFVSRCTLESFLDGHIRAFHYLGGVPAELLYDNMKHVVIRHLVGKVTFNPEMLHFAHHYGFTPKACPPYAAWVKGKVERPVDYIRESFWRGYHFSGLESANRDLHGWLDTVANRRIHGTHRQPVIERWQQEKTQLGLLPTADYDTSLKVFRKVYKDCQVSYEASRYVLPHDVVGKRVLLKVKNGTIHFFDDDRLLVSYAQAEGKHELVGNPMFYEALKADQDLQRRKYSRVKGKATRGLSIGSLFPQVMYRPLAEYESAVSGTQGGGLWNS